MTSKKEFSVNTSFLEYCVRDVGSIKKHKKAQTRTTKLPNILNNLGEVLKLMPIFLLLCSHASCCHLKFICMYYYSSERCFLSFSLVCYYYYFVSYRLQRGLLALRLWVFSALVLNLLFLFELIWLK